MCHIVENVCSRLGIQQFGLVVFRGAHAGLLVFFVNLFECVLVRFGSAFGVLFTGFLAQINLWYVSSPTHDPEGAEKVECVTPEEGPR